jgi:hypothetical protein
VLLPWTTVCEDGDADTEKSGVAAAFTTSVTEVLWLELPLVPVIVKVNVPVDVLLVVWTVRVELPAGGTVTEVGLSVQVVLLGQPLTVRLTVPLNPFSGVTVAV